MKKRGVIDRVVLTSENTSSMELRHSGEICWSLWEFYSGNQAGKTGQRAGCLVLLGPSVPLESLGGEATSVLPGVGTPPSSWAGSLLSSKLGCSFPRVPALRRTHQFLHPAG